MVEDLLQAHVKCFGLRAAVVRFFSIYGPGLDKQLLWDASRRLLRGTDPATFWGTGGETRDWIHVDDAATLMADLCEPGPEFRVVNGATGSRVTVAEVLERLRVALDSRVAIAFNGDLKAGDPRFYWADMTRVHALGWRPAISLDAGLANYAAWAAEAAR
jgi:UDP-glucose 4-epimerase